jgi:hypothetical protein
LLKLYNLWYVNNFLHHWNYIKDWHEFWFKFDNVQNQKLWHGSNVCELFCKRKKKRYISNSLLYICEGDLLMSYKYFCFMQIGKHPLNNFGLMDFQWTTFTINRQW